MVQKDSVKLLLIVGPTASGKSSLALAAAGMLNTEIISADSMQIYKKFNIGTAKENAEVRADVIHQMIDVVEPTDEFSVAEYQEQVDKHIARLADAGKTPIICGGTGLYIESIIYPLTFSDSARNIDLRRKLEQEYEVIGGVAMLKKLAELDCEAAAKLHPNDKRRIVRALEIFYTTGKKHNNELKTPRYDYLMIGLNTERAELYGRINNRVDAMFENGLLDEVSDLYKNEGVSFDNQAFAAIGYKEFKPFFDGTASLNEVKETIKKNTRNYAKRQITWFKRYKDIKWFGTDDSKLALNLIKNTFLE